MNESAWPLVNHCRDGHGGDALCPNAQADVRGCFGQAESRGCISPPL
jgi:hypothetical protein